MKTYPMSAADASWFHNDGPSNLAVVMGVTLTKEPLDFERVRQVYSERLVTFEGDSAWVTVQDPNGKTEQRTIKTGLSDAINLEVLEGLKAGERVAEKPVKEIK